MVFHVGFDAENGKVCAFDTKNKTKLKIYKTGTGIFGIRKDVSIYEQVDEIFSKINGEIGCICISLNRNDNDYRIDVLKYFKKKGFDNVEFIDEHSAKYISLAEQTDFKPKNGDFIWIFDENCCDIWAKGFQKAKLIESLTKYSSLKDISEQLSSEFHIPTAIFFNKEFCQFNLAEAKQKYPKCKILSYAKQDIEKSAMLKARIMADDHEVIAWNGNNVFDCEIIVTIEKTEIFKINRAESLPFTNREIIMVKRSDYSAARNINIAQSFTAASNLKTKNQYITKSVEFPAYEKFNFIFQIDKNGIHSVKFNEPFVFNDETFQFEQKSYNFLKRMFSFETENNVLGIDLGTTRCCAAVIRKNGIQTVALENTGERLLPSFVAYDEENVKFGKVVISRIRTCSKFTVFDVKRLIGKNMNQVIIDSIWPFTIVSMEEGEIYMTVEMFDGKQHTTSKHVSADLLKYIRDKAKDFQGRHLDNVVITVPAAFTPAQKQATYEAATLAGMHQIKLLPEPVAAAFAYFIDRPIPNHSTVLLFDLGGGTLDVCVFKIENNQIRIISNTGDTKLGGRDFDNVLINYFNNALKTDYGIEVEADKKYKLMFESQKIKEDLSVTEISSIDVSDYDPSKEGNIEISESEFRKMATELILKIKNTILAALYKSGYTAEEIKQVLQVGGGSRMPMIKQLIQTIFPKADRICEQNPDEVVAIGAAYYAYSIFSSELSS